MVYDFQDIATKIYIANMTRAWVNTGDNALIILQNREVKEITDADLSFNSSDDVVWTVLYLIGVGLLRYLTDANGKEFNIALRPDWKIPSWLNEPESKRKMRNHIDFILEAERQHRAAGLPLVCLIPSLDVISRAKTRLFRPREPNQEVEIDLALIKKNRHDYHTKLTFHRGGK